MVFSHENIRNFDHFSSETHINWWYFFTFLSHFLHTFRISMQKQDFFLKSSSKISQIIFHFLHWFIPTLFFHPFTYFLTFEIQKIVFHFLHWFIATLFFHPFSYFLTFELQIKFSFIQTDLHVFQLLAFYSSNLILTEISFVYQCALQTSIYKQSVV